MPGVAWCSPVHMRALLQSGASIDNPRVHGYLMAISVGLLLPLSIIISRNFKEYSNAVRAVRCFVLHFATRVVRHILCADCMRALTETLIASAVVPASPHSEHRSVGGW